MRELDVCEMAQGPRPGRKRRNLRWPAGRTRQARRAQCAGAVRPEAVAVGGGMMTAMSKRKSTAAVEGRRLASGSCARK